MALSGDGRQCWKLSRVVYIGLFLISLMYIFLWKEQFSVFSRDLCLFWYIYLRNERLRACFFISMSLFEWVFPCNEDSLNVLMFFFCLGMFSWKINHSACFFFVCVLGVWVCFHIIETISCTCMFYKSVFFVVVCSHVKGTIPCMIFISAFLCGYFVVWKKLFRACCFCLGIFLNNGTIHCIFI